MANLTKQQEYLLSRLPRNWRDEDDVEPEPDNIVAARRLIDDYETHQRKRQELRRVQMTKAINNAREAIYFKSAEEALEMIKALEERFGIQ